MAQNDPKISSQILSSIYGGTSPSRGELWRLINEYNRDLIPKQDAVDAQDVAMKVTHPTRDRLEQSDTIMTSMYQSVNLLFGVINAKDFQATLSNVHIVLSAPQRSISLRDVLRLPHMPYSTYCADAWASTANTILGILINITMARIKDMTDQLADIGMFDVSPKVHNLIEIYDAGELSPGNDTLNILVSGGLNAMFSPR
jgi:hypothetical protein